MPNWVLRDQAQFFTSRWTDEWRSRSIKEVLQVDNSVSNMQISETYPGRGGGGGGAGKTWAPICFARHIEHRIRNTFRAPTMPKKNHKKEEGTLKKHWICRHQKYLEELPLGHRDLGNVMARKGLKKMIMEVKSLLWVYRQREDKYYLMVEHVISSVNSEWSEKQGEGRGSSTALSWNRRHPPSTSLLTHTKGSSPCWCTFLGYCDNRHFRGVRKRPVGKLEEFYFTRRNLFLSS